ncbi:cysteine dioxygenase [Asanoa siamensis]|nr:cysteine dioxygenase family protein [Asanoa siamensis]
MFLPDDLLSVARRYAGDPAAWPVTPRFDPVERWYQRIAATPEHEVWLLTWLPGQHTDLHDHGGASGGFTVVSGALTEETVQRGTLRTKALPPGAGRRFGPRYVHRVSNNGPDPAISVHCYAPELTTMTRYDLIDGALRVADVARAGVAW